VDHFTSRPIDLPRPSARGTFYRADLIFEGVDHSGASYEARIFLDNPDAGPDTPRDPEHGYAGSYTIFGHGGCVGEEGHCDPGTRTTDAFDLRPPHPLEPITKTVPITEALRATTGETMTVTVVPVVPHPDGARTEDVLDFERIRLATYE
jgi:tyrosinase